MHTQSSRGVLKLELAKNIIWDDPSVFAHLGVASVDADFVERTIRRFEKTEDLRSARASLQRPAANTREKETAMYPLLVCPSNIDV